MYLQAVWQLGDGLLQEQSHEQEVQLRHVGVFGQQSLQHRESWEVASVPVDLSHRGAPAGTAAHVEAYRVRSECEEYCLKEDRRHYCTHTL